MKYIVSSIVFLAIMIAGCLLWYKYDTNPDRQAAAKAEELLHQWELSKTKRKQGIKRSPDTITYTEQNPNNNTTFKTKYQDILVSPLGFGPFPDIPTDYPYLNNWDRFLNPEPKPDDWPPNEYAPSWEYNQQSWELIARVRLKLWKQGFDAEGLCMPGAPNNPHKGKIYPMIPGHVYIEYVNDRMVIMNSHTDDDLGIIQDFKELYSYYTEHGEIDDMIELDAIKEIGFTIDDIPSHLKVIEGGIDPYTFLDIPR